MIPLNVEINQLIFFLFFFLFLKMCPFCRLGGVRLSSKLWYYRLQRIETLTALINSTRLNSKQWEKEYVIYIHSKPNLTNHTYPRVNGLKNWIEFRIGEYKNNQSKCSPQGSVLYTRAT